jgi:dinuclear metal center YbgI/SA1388 family protein
MSEVTLGALASYLDRYLEVAGVSDYGPNGLQVEGRERVRRLATGVSACRELFTRAREWRADSVLVHHGLFWQGMPYSLTGVQYRRVAELMRSEISLLAYHLPLDRHPEVGNNAVAARALGLEGLAPFGVHAGTAIGYRGAFPEPLPFTEVLARCERLYGQRPLAFAGRPSAVSTVGIVSGGAQKELHQAIAEGLEVFITGEASEWVMNVALESGTHFVAAGHYATERLGVQALGAHLAERFGLEVEFIDVPNPV